MYKFLINCSDVLLVSRFVADLHFLLYIYTHVYSHFSGFVQYSLIDSSLAWVPSKDAF